MAGKDTKTMDLLSDDILLHIFSFLDALSLCKVRRVCKRWLELSTDDILWKHKLMTDVYSWKQVSHTSVPEQFLQSELPPVELNMPNHELYARASPDIQKWRKMFYQQSTLHQLTDFLKNFLPSKKFLLGVGASAMDSYGKGQSFFSKLLSFDAGNVFQHCGQFPGKFRGHGGGFLFKYKRSMLELCLMYVAPKKLRECMTVEEKLSHLTNHMESEGYKQLLQSLDGYIHTIDSRVLEGSTADETVKKIEVEGQEVDLLNKHLKPDIPILILSSRKVESDPHIPSYQVAKALHLQQLTRPWMVAECSAQMIYRDVQDPIDWLLCTAKPH